ncbi:CBS domain-containing protein [Lactobacillus apis]|uniref:CBS domain-containing protein n=1 Tax=Lactobacillus apis TaxID=303541 RepID=UPI00242D0A06|nr:CBS domain-containing protein [Lactobacillus apis]
MFSPSIQHLLEDKSGSFIIPASRIAFVEDDNPLYHAFMILTRVKYSKVPVLDSKNRVVGLLSLAMITNKMMATDKINFAQTTLEAQLHLLVDNAFLPVVDNHGVFQGLLTRREWIKAFNYVAHNFENKYQVKQI